MTRPLLVALLAAAVAGWGCSSDRPQVLPGEDPNALATAIAAKGQDTSATGPALPDSTIPGDCARVALVIGGGCLAAPILYLRAMCQSGAHYP